MSVDQRKAWRITKAVLAYLIVPIFVSMAIIFILSALQVVIERTPESWSLETPFIFLMMAWGAWICVPVAWLVGPLTFSLDPGSGSRRLMWRQTALGSCIGGGIAGFFGLMLGGILFGLMLVVAGAVLGAIHALGLRYALLGLGLIEPGTATDVRTKW